MRSGLFGLASTSAFVVSGVVALASISPAHAQSKPAAKPAAAQPAKGAGPKIDAKAKVDKTACATEPKPKLSDSKKKDEAKKAFNEGKTRLDKSDYEGALTCFRLADAYIPGPAPKYRAALALDKLGRVTEAVAAYQAFLDDAGPTPSDKYKDLVDEGKARMAQLKQTPAKVKVAIGPAEATDAKISVDGAPQAGMELSVPPGKHTLSIMATGYDTATQEIEVTFAETKDVSVTLNKTPEPVATVVPTAEPTAEPTATAVATATAPVEPPAQKSYVPAYVTLGLAGAGAIVGGIFGGMALSSKSDFDAAPSVEKADETDRNALIADMSFAVALTFGVTGAVLLLSDAGQPASAPAKTGTIGSKSRKASLPRGFIAPYATPNGGGAAARFTF